MSKASTVTPWPWNLGYGSFHVTETGTIQKIGCYFLFAFRSNDDSIRYRLRNIASYWSKIAKFLYSTCIKCPAGGDPVGILRRCLIFVKLEWLGYRVVKKLWQYVKPFWQNTGTWRTDGQTQLLYQYRASVCWCAIKTEIFFLNFRIVVGSLPHNPRNLGIKISHSCREIAFCPVGYFNLSHPVEWLDYRVVKKLWQYVKPFSYNTVHNATDRPRDRQTDRIATLMLCISTLTCNKMHNFHTVSVQNTHYAS